MSENVDAELIVKNTFPDDAENNQKQIAKRQQVFGSFGVIFHFKDLLAKNFQNYTKLFQSKFLG